MTFIQAGTAGVPGLDTQNSTTTPLSGSATYTGGWSDVSAFATVTVAAKSDVAGTLYLEFANDSSQANADSTLTYAVAAGINEVHTLKRTRQFFRVRYVNGSTDQTTFEISAFAEQGAFLSAPLNLSLGQDADAIAVRAIESEIDIAEGKRSGYSIVNKFGRNSDVDAAEDVWDGGGSYTGFPISTSELVTVVSSSTNDTSAGSGARTVKIFGLDANGAEQEETVTLDGTTLVDSVNTYSRVNRAIVLTSGGTPTNSAFNAGAISVAHKTTTSNIFIVMPIGANQSQVCAYTIPAGKTGYLRKLNCFIDRSASATADGALWVRENGASPRLIRIFSVSQSDSINDEIYGGLVFPALTDIVVRITAVSTTNVEVTASFDLILVDN